MFVLVCADLVWTDQVNTKRVPRNGFYFLGWQLTILGTALLEFLAHYARLANTFDHGAKTTPSVA